MHARQTTRVGLTPGKRIEMLRRRRGLSRQTLACLIGYSAEWLRQVERNERPVDRLSTLLRMAEVLRVDDVPAFLGIAPELPLPRAPVEVNGAPLRAALLLRPGTGSRQAADDQLVARLRDRLAAAWSAWQNSPRRYSRAKAELPGLVADVRAVETADPDVFAHTHRLAAAFLRQTGQLPLALLAAERSRAAADRSQNPLTGVACTGAFAATLLALGCPAEARQVCLTTADRLTGELDCGAPEPLSVWGTIHLTAAEAAATENDHLGAERLLEIARAAADRLGEDRNDLASSFGPTDVTVHTVRIEVLLGRVRRALRLANTVAVAGRVTAERQARHCITLAHAHSLDNDPVAATFALLQAEDACAEEIRCNAEARSVIQYVVCADNARVHRELWGLVGRAGLM